MPEVQHAAGSAARDEATVDARSESGPASAPSSPTGGRARVHGTGASCPREGAGRARRRSGHQPCRHHGLHHLQRAVGAGARWVQRRRPCSGARRRSARCCLGGRGSLLQGDWLPRRQGAVVGSAWWSPPMAVPKVLAHLAGPDQSRRSQECPVIRCRSTGPSSSGQFPVDLTRGRAPASGAPPVGGASIHRTDFLRARYQLAPVNPLSC